MTPGSHPPQKGSLLLLVMCLLAVLGIALAGYLAVSNQSMKFSNRSYAADVSRHLAAMGLEQALGSFTSNTFSGGWTLSGNTAKKTLTTFSSPHVPTTYGNSGITPSVNIRVDNYRNTVSNKAVAWSAFTTYAANDYVWYQGVWYLCKTAPTVGSVPSSANWTAAPAPWNGRANYQSDNIVIFGNSAYRCAAANVNQTPPNGTYWTSQSPAASTWSSATTYNINDVVFSGGVSYRCINSSTNNTPPNTTFWVSIPVIYAEGVATLNDSAGTTIKTQLRAYVAPAPLFPNALAATTLVTLSSTGTVDSYNSPLATWSAAQPYSSGDVVRIGTTYYRCTAPNTNQTPPSASWTTTTPLGYSAVIAGGSTSSTAVTVVSAVIGGYVAAPSSTTSPYASNCYAGFSPGATTPSLTNSDGSVTSPHGSAAKVDLTRISRSPYIPQFDIQSISTGTNLPAAYSISGPSTTLIDGAVILGTAGGPVVIYNITATHDNPSGINYPGLDLYNSGQNLTINGPVILNVTGLFRLAQGIITIANGGSLEVYFTGLLDVGNPSYASAGIFNNTNDPSKMLIVGTSSTNTVDNHYVRTKNPLSAVIYMPNAYLTMKNGGYTNQLFGAFSASNIKFTNAVNFRYDTALRTAGAIGTFIDAPYSIIEWRELTDPTEKAVLP